MQARPFCKFQAANITNIAYKQHFSTKKSQASQKLNSAASICLHLVRMRDAFSKNTTSN
jgi:hypothetical protein